ncbi:hypothetical protein QTP70_035198, partial [Hemibagrus guttatus]
MPGGKAPGIDGLPVEFYKFFWKELGEDLLEVLKESCRESCLPLSSRRAVITLLPKKGDLQDIQNWCPVSLLCTDYKLMSKALANRLRDIMDSVIQTDQTYCVPNRSIIDNVSLIQDILDVSRLCKCGVSDEGCAALTSALRSNPSHLRDLDLSENNLGDSGKKLLSALKDDEHYKLQTL